MGPIQFRSWWDAAFLLLCLLLFTSLAVYPAWSRWLVDSFYAIIGVAVLVVVYRDMRS